MLDLVYVHGTIVRTFYYQPDEIGLWKVRHVGGESGWKWKSPKSGGMHSKPIHLSETEVLIMA
jgi:hypothetical protein